MPRTTMNLDGSVLEELRKLQEREGRPLGDIASELVAEALKGRKSSRPRPFKWNAGALGLKIDLRDKEALQRALDEDRDRRR